MAPYFAKRPACAMASGIPSLAGKMPNDPRAQCCSSNAASALKRTWGPCSRNRHRVPGMRGHDGGCGMVAGDHEHIRMQVQQRRDLRVQLLQALDLGGEIAVLPGGVREFVMDEEEIMLGPVQTQTGDLIR